TPVATVNADGTLTVTGLSTGDKVQWATSGAHNRVLIENISNADGVAGNDNNTFDIGGFALTQSQPAPDEKLDFTVRITDADGDTASDSFSIGIDGTGTFDDNQVGGIVLSQLVAALSNPLSAAAAVFPSSISDAPTSGT